MRLKPGDQAGVEIGDGGVQQTLVHAAHELGVVPGEPVEGAIAQDDGAVVADGGLVAEAGKRVEQRGALRLLARGAPKARKDSVCDGAAPAFARLAKGRGDGDTFGSGYVDGVCEQASGELVARGGRLTANWRSARR